MRAFPQIEVPGDVVAIMRDKYKMLPSDINKAIRDYMELILDKWDEECVTFQQFLEMDDEMGFCEYTHNDHDDD